jgi:hypothetical protein
MKLKRFFSGFISVTFITFVIFCGCEPESTLETYDNVMVVNSASDSGPGTLRQALLNAESGDIITFDPDVFSPTAPETIYISSELPYIDQGNLTIDASNAGVIINGSNIPEGEWASGLEINSNGNTVQGLQIINFSPGAGISLVGQAQNNTIGGDYSVGSGPIGQGNLLGGGDIGIRICGTNVSFNTITGNLVGTDVNSIENWGNDGSGVRIEEGASNNIIGPDNNIAYNSAYGVEIAIPDSFGNAIIQNSIHDNNGEGIYLCQGSNAGIDAPLIIGYDLANGTVTGITESYCTVEIFSDYESEGAIYEGQTKADGDGVFNFNKNAPFNGPHLTVTATDSNNNTSPFSTHTWDAMGSIALQKKNYLGITKIQHKRSEELLDNNMGDFVSLKRADETFSRDYLNLIINSGYKLSFLTIDWFDFTEVLETGEYSEPIITPEQDKVITDLVDNGIKIVYCLVYYEPVEIDVPFSFENLEDYLVKNPDKEGRFKTEGEIQRYLDYVRFIVSHFKDRIRYYQILNEPLNGIIGQYVKSEDYINLIKRVVPVIRDECPDAKIIVGSVFGLPNEYGSIPGEPTCYEYLFNILNSDVMPLVDGISFHPSPDLSPEYDSACYFGVPCDDISEGYYKYYQQTIQEIKDVAFSNGFNGEFITEGPTFACQVLPPQTHYYNDIISAKYYGRSIIMNLSENITVILPLGKGTLKRIVIQNLCTIMAGAEPVSFPIEIQSEATNIENYTFSLPDESYLIALWTDSVAVDSDPGVESNIILQDFSAQKVIGMDVLNGFEQQIVTNIEDGNLVIKNLLVKDYPIILHLIP